jgi:hypothetical protein
VKNDSCSQAGSQFTHFGCLHHLLSKLGLTLNRGLKRKVVAAALQLI